MSYTPSLFRVLIWTGLLLGCLQACKTSQTKGKTASAATTRVAFYNVENLFDCVDEPNKLDDDFTPTGRNEWTKVRYQKKLQQLDRVFGEMGYPAIIGLAEVENATVLKDLITILTTKSGQTYAFKHWDSPDKRGIDCALLYQVEAYQVDQFRHIRIPFPEAISGEPDYTSRDILHIRGQTTSGETLHCLVNHWPSRRGGLKQSEPKRMHVARYLRRYTDSLTTAQSQAKLLLMGDFNDEPDNRSITDILDTRTDSPAFYNLMDELDATGQGSYKYRGKWNMLDQFLVSPALKNGPGLSAKPAKIFKPEWLCFQHPKYGEVPNRTYGGPNYYGGFSDHFAIYLDLVH